MSAEQTSFINTGVRSCSITHFFLSSNRQHVSDVLLQITWCALADVCSRRSINQLVVCRAVVSLHVLMGFFCFNFHCFCFSTILVHHHILSLFCSSSSFFSSFFLSLTPLPNLIRTDSRRRY